MSGKDRRFCWTRKMLDEFERRYRRGDSIEDLCKRFGCSKGSAWHVVSYYQMPRGMRTPRPKGTWRPTDPGVLQLLRADRYVRVGQSVRLHHARRRAGKLDIDHSGDATAVAEFIEAHGVTRCPPAACAPTQAFPDVYNHHFDVTAAKRGRRSMHSAV